MGGIAKSLNTRIAVALLVGLTLFSAPRAFGDLEVSSGGTGSGSSGGSGGGSCSATAGEVQNKAKLKNCETINQLCQTAESDYGNSGPGGHCLKGVRKTFQKVLNNGVEGLPWCRSAKDAGKCMEQIGYKMDAEALEKAKSDHNYKFKKGAVLIYKSSDPNHDGHIEIFTGKKYCSDYCSAGRRDYSETGDRILIGVYYPPAENCSDT